MDIDGRNPDGAPSQPSAGSGQQQSSVEMLEVEDQDQRAKRFQFMFERMNASSTASRTPTNVPEFKFDFGERKTFAVPPSQLLSRVQAFLPQMEASNALLAQKAQADPTSVDIEHVENGTERYIEMNLGLGVFETKKAPSDEDTEMSSSDSSSSSMSSSDSDSNSATSSTSSSSDSDEDEDEWDPDQILSFFLPSRLLRHNSDSSNGSMDSEEGLPEAKARRLISPLPRRTSSARNREVELLRHQHQREAERQQPSIVVLGETESDSKDWEDGNGMVQ
ncbi:hypothetical protein D9758_007973 [Tetrapyrgos nigripes]|uniref:Uncharacterized protein n=1 Tax=Tetrapyrgos nigripes TaxID=182062 RepID=A0A8H5D0F1_9AGAR|nr:hypothetical protein D9758_007973 [Tetrapyrgos nigripes]